MLVDASGAAGVRFEIDFMALQTVLVTGGSGFIGGRLVGRLSKRDCRVWCLVRGESEELRSTGAQLIVGDVTDRGSVERALGESQADTVFHLAGLVRARRRGDFARVNAGGTENVAAACAGRANPPVLVVVSSLSAAGPGAAGRLRVEEDVPTPVSAYGRSKLAGEAAAATHASIVPTSILRPPIVFGPGDRAVLEMIRPIARWGVHLVPGWGGGSHRLLLIHVDDMVEGLLLAAEKGERVGVGGLPGRGVYFLAGEENPTYVELGQAMSGALGRKSPANVRVPGWLLKLAGIGGDVKGWVGGQPAWINSDKMNEALAGSWVCSAAKARSQLGWSPAASLADRLRETVRWYRQAGWL